MMFEKLKRFFQGTNIQEEVDKTVEPSPSPVLITIHGYGRRRQHEMDNLSLWCDKEALEIVQFDMYDLFDEKDCDWIKWVDRAKAVVKSYEQSGREVYLLGFSMGGVIASYLAATTPYIHKLILIAPAFNYFHVETITSVITKGAGMLFSNDKEKHKQNGEVEVPRSFYSAFMDVVKSLKRYIEEVSCPVLILHGDEDEVIPLRSSTWAYEKIPHEDKKLIILHKGHHRLLMDPMVCWETFQIMKLFLDNKILNKEEIEFAPDILDIYRQQWLDKQENMQEENCSSM